MGTCRILFLVGFKSETVPFFTRRLKDLCFFEGFKSETVPNVCFLQAPGILCVCGRLRGTQFRHFGVPFPPCPFKKDRPMWPFVEAKCPCEFC